LRRFVLDPAAKVDLRKAKRYYEKKRLGLGKEFLAKVWDRIQQLLLHPFSAPVVEYHVRRARVDLFHFDLYYYIENDEIFIIAVIHQRQHQDTWKKRL